MSGTRKSRATGNSDRSLSNLRPWKPGESGNPAGRPKGVAAAVRSRLEDRMGGPDALADALIDSLEDSRLKPMERVAIVRELWDRGYGKAPTHEAIAGADPLELGAIAEEIQGIADELARRRAERTEAPTGDASSATG